MRSFHAEKVSNAVKKSRHDYMARRQAANYERFVQEKADVFQLTDIKDQAMFWVLQ